MVQVNFTKRFVKGCLVGIELADKLHFASNTAAQDFVKHCESHVAKPVKAIGGADYTCHNIAVQTIEVDFNEIELN